MLLMMMFSGNSPNDILLQIYPHTQAAYSKWFDFEKIVSHFVSWFTRRYLFSGLVWSIIFASVTVGWQPTHIAPLDQLPGSVALYLPKLIYIWSLLIHRFVTKKTDSLYNTVLIKYVPCDIPILCCVLCSYWLYFFMMDSAALFTHIIYSWLPQSSEVTMCMSVWACACICVNNKHSTMLTFCKLIWICFIFNILTRQLSFIICQQVHL